MDELKSENFDQSVGIKIVKAACRIPCKTICSNAGYEGSIVVDKLIEENNRSKGYDAAKGVYCDMMKVGIIDPTKVVRTALVDAAGVASLMLTTDAAVVDLPRNEKEAGGAQGMGGGMGGMGGMY